MDEQSAMYKWFKIKASSLPTLEKGKLTVSLDSFRKDWPNLTVQPPNPLFNHLPLKAEIQKGKDKIEIEVSPLEMYMLKPLCFWVPDVFFHHIIPCLPCPSCYNKKKSNYFTMKSDGWGKSPRRVFCHTGTYYVVSKRYRCSNSTCGRRCIGYDSELVALLPNSVAAYLPCFMTQNAALDVGTLNLLKRQVVSGQSFDDFADMLNEICTGIYYQRQYIYYAEAMRKYHHPMRNFMEAPNIPSFGTLDGDFDHCNIDSEYLRSVYVVDGNRELPWLTQRLAMIDGEILAVDHSFKATKKIKVRDEQSKRFIPAFSATLTVLNEYHQVAGQYLAHSKSYKHVQHKLKDLLDRYDVYKYNKPTVIYTDNCCNDKAELSIFESAQIRLDAYHFMDRYHDGCRQRHPAFVGFCKQLRRAIFVLHEEDKSTIVEELKAQNIVVTDNELVKRCRRFIPEPKILEHRINQVYNTYKDAFYVSENEKVFLFKSSMKSIHENALVHVRNNCLSDPPEIGLYFQRVENRNGVSFGCKRGTSALEGYHSGLKSIFQGGSVSAELAQIMLTNYNFRWNIRNGIKNRGEKNYGFYDHHLLERIKMIGDSFNLNLYEEYRIANPKVKESFGCIGIAHGVELQFIQCQYASDMDVEDDDIKKVSNKRVRSDNYIAKHSNLPSLPKPVQSKHEKELFMELFAIHQTDFLKMAHDFNVRVAQQADDENCILRFKTADDLKTYHERINKAVAGKNAVTNTRKQHRRLKTMQNNFNAPIQNSPRVVTTNALPMQPWQYAIHPTSFVPMLPFSPFGSNVSQFQITMGELPPSPMVSLSKKRKMHCRHCGEHKTKENNHMRSFCPKKNTEN